MSTIGFGSPWLWTPRLAANLPQTATEALFTVIGGRCRVSLVIGRVTTALSADVSSGKLLYDPTDGAADSDITAAVALASLAQGLWLWVSGTTLVISTNGGAALTTSGFVAAPQNGNAFMAEPGNISLNTTGNQTGQIEWYCAWRPWEAGARVVVA